MHDFVKIKSIKTAFTLGCLKSTKELITFICMQSLNQQPSVVFVSYSRQANHKWSFFVRMCLRKYIRPRVICHGSLYLQELLFMSLHPCCVNVNGVIEALRKSVFIQHPNYPNKSWNMGSCMLYCGPLFRGTWSKSMKTRS